jgi:hypothetical protein
VCRTGIEKGGGRRQKRGYGGQARQGQGQGACLAHLAAFNLTFGAEALFWKIKFGLGSHKGTAA